MPFSTISMGLKGFDNKFRNIEKTEISVSGEKTFAFSQILGPHLYKNKNAATRIFLIEAFVYPEKKTPTSLIPSYLKPCDRRR